MICDTVRKGQECALMTSKGCSYNGGACHGIIDKCKGCSRAAEVSSGWYCTAYPEPSIKWKVGQCNMATHVKKAATSNAQKLNPIKASKRGSR